MVKKQVFFIFVAVISCFFVRIQAFEPFGSPAWQKAMGEQQLMAGRKAIVAIQNGMQQALIQETKGQRNPLSLASLLHGSAGEPLRILLPSNQIAQLSLNIAAYDAAFTELDVEKRAAKIREQKEILDESLAAYNHAFGSQIYHKPTSKIIQKKDRIADQTYSVVTPKSDAVIKNNQDQEFRHGSRKSGIKSIIHDDSANDNSIVMPEKGSADMSDTISDDIIGPEGNEIDLSQIPQEILDQLELPKKDTDANGAGILSGAGLSGLLSNVFKWVKNNPGQTAETAVIAGLALYAFYAKMTNKWPFNPEKSHETII